MKKVLFAAVWMLVAGLWPVLAQSGATESARDKLIGSWRLAWDEEQTADGKMVKLEETGIIMYTRDGHMAVQIMRSDKPGQAVNNPVQYEQSGYEAYYGTYDVDETAHAVTHHVQGALVRSLIGKDLTRVYRFEGKQLILKSSRPDEHWTIAWEHN
ncbi:MAG TPA: lipocalin-like domain-containing protein [Candidatus Sulfotelmatobacter sp.]|nr:lipocalin-like domain-containing protein [Candidatus Sulfotelmatobacter sp.]